MAKDKKDFMTGHDPKVGRDSFAGLPEDKVMGAYPKAFQKKGYRIDDSISGVDASQIDSDALTRKYESRQK